MQQMSRFPMEFLMVCLVSLNRMVIPILLSIGSKRPKEHEFYQKDFRLYDAQGDQVPNNYFLSDFQVGRMLAAGEASHVNHPADFTAESKIRSSRTNKGEACKEKIHGQWYYKVYDD